MSGLWFSDEYYNPVQAGSIDGTDTVAHDRGIARAGKISYDPNRDSKIAGDPYKTLFVCRLSWETTETTLHEVFSKYGKIVNLRLVRDIVTGHSKGYAFITYERSKEFFDAYKNTNKMLVDGREILVEFERERIAEGWVPRRYGGGIGGRKESGQLRFGGRDRPFRRPIMAPIPETASSRFDMRNDIDRFAGRKYYEENDNNINTTDTIDESTRDRGRENSKDYSSEHRDRRDYKHRSRSRERRRSRSRDRDREHRRDSKRRREDYGIPTDARNEDAKQTG